MFTSMGRGIGRGSPWIAVTVAICLSLAACTGAAEPGSTTDSDGTESPSKGSSAAVFDKFNEMTGQERHDALVEQAQAEGGVVIYTTAPGYEPVFEAFTEKYGIEVEVFVGRSDTLMQRVTQEFEAGVHLVDIVEDEFSRVLAQMGGITYQYVNEELTADLLGYVPETHMVPFRLTVPAVTWNTELVSDDQIPETIEGLVDPMWEGKMVLDAGAFDWYATIRTYLIDDLGYTEEEADEFFATLIDNSAPQPTSFAMHALLAAGEYSLSTGLITTITDWGTDDGAPVAWRTADGGYVAPIVVLPEGGVLMANAPHPAAGLLLMDFFIEEGSPLLQENHFPSPAPTDGHTLEGVAEEDILFVDPSVMSEDRERWRQEWDALITAG